MPQRFLSKNPGLEDYWRAIILIGQNSASFKFALAKCLLELRPESGQVLTLDELAKPYSRNIAEHLKKVNKQGTARSSKFLDACRGFNSGEVSETQLVEQTVRLGFNNVIDAFHVVGGSPIVKPFFVDERKTGGGIKITDEFSILAATSQFGSLTPEAEARWRLVETAWSIGVSPVVIQYDSDSNNLLGVFQENRRPTLTSCRNTLNGYQKGHCFYCFREISLIDDDLKSEVEHFFPRTLIELDKHRFSSIDEIWNLVLACWDCNRGRDIGKHVAVPSTRLLERLFTRNEFWIESKPPLSETLMRQTGGKLSARLQFLQKYHNDARALLIHLWEPEEVEEPTF